MLVLAGLTAIDGDIALVVAVAIAATCFSSFFGPAIGAYLPTLVKDESDLGPANTAYATLNEITYIVGSSARRGRHRACSTCRSRSFSTRSRSRSPRRSSGRSPPLVRGRETRTTARSPASRRSTGTTRTEWPRTVQAPKGRRATHRSGARGANSLRPLAGLAIVDAGSSFAFGGVAVITVVIAYEQLGAGETGTGALNAAMGIGGLVGSFVTGVLVLRRRLDAPLLLGAAALGVGIIVLGASGSVWLAMLAIAAASGGALLIEVICTTLLQRVAPDEVRGRAFGAMQTVDVLAFAGGSIAIPALTEWFGLAPVLLACGIAIIGATLVAGILLGDWLTAAPSADPARARLGKVPMLAGLSPARLELAERRAVPIPMQASDVIIRQGDEADRFYVIVDGTVDVTQATDAEPTPRHLRTMGEGEAFGEIGLLTGVPRTATVTAATDGQLLALDRDDFLELVGEAGAGTFPLADPYLGRVPAGGLEAMLEGSR